MMSNTPRVFVGTTTFLVAGLTSSVDLQIATSAIQGFPGVRVVAIDQIAGLITVTAERPVDRSELTAAINQAGFAVLG